MRSLHATYADRGVVFLEIHRPEADIKKIREHHTLRQWETPAGIDEKLDGGGGATEQKYSGGFVVIGRDGKVAFNIGALDEESAMRLFYRAAKKLSIRWPLKEDGPKDEVERQHLQISDALIKEQIDKALGAP